MSDYLYNNTDLIEFIGEDLVFLLKAIYTDEAGFNLRNLVSHGLVDDSDFDSCAAIFTWALIIHLALKMPKKLYTEIYSKPDSTSESNTLKSSNDTDVDDK